MKPRVQAAIDIKSRVDTTLKDKLTIPRAFNAYAVIQCKVTVDIKFKIINGNNIQFLYSFCFHGQPMQKNREYMEKGGRTSKNMHVAECVTLFQLLYTTGFVFGT